MSSSLDILTRLRSGHNFHARSLQVGRENSKRLWPELSFGSRFGPLCLPTLKTRAALESLTNLAGANLSLTLKRIRYRRSLVNRLRASRKRNRFPLWNLVVGQTLHLFCGVDEFRAPDKDD